MASKQERIAAAEYALALKRARETNSLSITFLRVASVLLTLIDELKALKASGVDFQENLVTAVRGMEVTRASRVSALITLFYASLNVVVEGWSDPNQATPRLADPKIDALLASEHKPLLAGFRNAMLHPNPLLDRRFLEFGEAHPRLLPWAQELCDEFLRFFRAWRKNLDPEYWKEM